MLLQLFVWYGLLLRLPDARQAWEPLPSVLLSNRGLALPALQGWLPQAASLIVAMLIAGWAIRRRRLATDGPAHRGHVLLIRVAPWLALAGLLLAWTFLPAPIVELPVRRGLGLQGGWQPSIEFATLVIGLSVFHAAYIADIVRASVRAVPGGLVEAGQALALSRLDILRLVVAPNAARVALPPYANQCLALIKNSTLAIAIGYQDLMAVINTAITQTGLALEGISLALAAIWAWPWRWAARCPRGTRAAPGMAGRSAWRAPGRTAGIACRPRGARRRTLGAATGQDGRAAGGAARRRFARRLGLAQRRLARRRGGLRASRRRLLGRRGREPAPVAVRRDAAGASRPALVACAALLLAVAVALGAGRLSGRIRAGVAIAALALAAGALSGWPWGGEAIGPLRWGGLLVTLILAIAALLAAVPLAVGLALLRRSSGPAGSFAAATLIEAVRGVPLVTQLLFASFVLPMLLGGGVSKFSMALAALTLHTACLLAEVLRGALQAIPPGQMAAARALGMGSALAYQAVIWPQARRIAAPAALGVFVGAVKDTSLVSIIGVFDVLGAAKAVVAGTAWRPITSRSTWRWPRCTSRPAWRCRGWRGRWNGAALNGLPPEAFVEDRRQHQFPHERRVGQAEQRAHHRHHIVHRRQRALAAPAGLIARHRQPVLGVPGSPAAGR